MADMDFDLLGLAKRLSRLVDAGADFGGVMRILDMFRRKPKEAASGTPASSGSNPNPILDIITTDTPGVSDEQTLLYLESLCGVSKRPTATHVSAAERRAFGRLLSLLTKGEAATLMRGITRGGESEITVKVTETDSAAAAVPVTTPATTGKKPAVAKPRVTTREYIIKATIRGIGIIKALAADILSGSDEAAQLAIATGLVVHLRQAGVLKNSADTRAHLGKSAGLIQKEADTLSYEWRARMKLRFNSMRYAELMSTPVLMAKRAEIEAAKAADEHDTCLRLHEEYQGLLIQETKVLIERVIGESAVPPLVIPPYTRPEDIAGLRIRHTTRRITADWTTTDKLLRIGGPVLIALFLLILAMN